MSRSEVDDQSIDAQIAVRADRLLAELKTDRATLSVERLSGGLKNLDQGRDAVDAVIDAVQQLRRAAKG
jgi:hypothetical protein